MFEFKMTVIYIPAAKGTICDSLSLLFFFSRQDECLSEVLFPPITSQPAGSSPEPATRSVCLQTPHCFTYSLTLCRHSFVFVFLPRMSHFPHVLVFLLNQHQLANNFVNWSKAITAAVYGGSLSNFG